ncbi:MAG TPA: hypothetical protein VER77_02935 [Candidatus Dormibacteraeota bacterium]|nr:hypothetical protein [Candidatus Dormibacteraeota bacterium]
MSSGPLAALTIAILVWSGAAAAEPLFLPASSQGGWLAADKQIHFAGCLAISASLRVAGRSDGESVGGAIGVGVLKEIYDATLKPRRKGRGASWKDLAADVLGAAAGIAIAGALDR